LEYWNNLDGNEKLNTTKMKKRLFKKEPEIIKDYYKNLMASDFHHFPKKGRVKVTDNHGVYIIFSPDNEVLHVGNTPSGRNGLNQRLYNHITKTGVFYRKYLKKYNISLRGMHKFKYLVVHDVRHRALLEALTAGSLCPAHFGTGERKKINPS